jgi:hypothetical protein
MRIRRLTMATFFAVATIASQAQQAELLTELPQTKEQFIASEKNVLATINWLENTTVKNEEEKHKQQYALLLAWITNSPTVTIEVNADALTFTKKNSDLLMMFMAGWIRYALQNNYAKDEVQGTLAGIRCAAKVYKAGELKKDKEMQKLIDLDEKGELENWVREKLGRK